MEILKNDAEKLHIREELLWLPEEDERNERRKLGKIGFWTGN